MSVLKWDKYEVLECLEVAPEIEEHDISFSYNVVQEKLTLLITIWQYDKVVQFTMLDTNSQLPVLKFTVLVRGGIYRKKYKNLELLEIQDCDFVTDRFYYIETGDIFDKKIWPCGITLEVSVKPQIRIEFIGVDDSPNQIP